MEIKSAEVVSEFKAEVGDDGEVVLKKKENIDRGAKSRSSGGAFELRVRKDLEEKGWTVDKWSNNIDMTPLDKDQTGRAPLDSLGHQTGRADSPKVWKLVPCKRVFKRFGVGKGVMTIGTGFPDFVAFDRRDNLFEVIGVEVKMNGTLSREEKEKCSWLLEMGIFSQILIASKVKEKNRVKVSYLDFLEIKRRMRTS